MYNDPLLTPEQNAKNKQRLQGALENSASKLTDENSIKSDEQFRTDLLKHCDVLRALESYNKP